MTTKFENEIFVHIPRHINWKICGIPA